MQEEGKEGREQGDRRLKFGGEASGAKGGLEPQYGGEWLLPLGRTKGLLAVYTGADAGEFMSHERLINPRRSFLRQRSQGGFCKVGQAQARPEPVDGLFDRPDAGAYLNSVTRGTLRPGRSGVLRMSWASRVRMVAWP